MPRVSLSVVAIIAAAVLLGIVSWLDVVAIPEARRMAAATFDASGVVTGTLLATFVVGASCVALAWLAWRSTAAVGLAYAAVGALFMFLPWLGWHLSSEAPLPQPVLTAIRTAHSWTVGPLYAAATVGAAMLIAGGIGAMRSLRRVTPVSPGSDAPEASSAT
jgi:hypothetical protein